MPIFALTVGFLFVLIGAQFLLSRYRRSLPIFSEWKTFKSRLPAWVKRTEMVVQLCWWFLLSFGLVAVFSTFHIVQHPYQHEPDPQGAVIVIPASFVIMWPLAALLANAISYTVPAIRRANAEAFDGLKVASLRRANLELVALFFGYIMLFVPFVLIVLIEPWSG